METLDFTFERREELIKKEYYNDGLNDGISQGRIICLLDNIIKKVKKQKSLEVIADETEEDIDYIKPMYDVIITNPDKNAEKIFDLLQIRK